MMKRFSRLTMMVLVALLACQQLQAKKHSFVQEGKRWVFYGGEEDERVTYMMKGDTVINGEKYKKLYRSNDNETFAYHGALHDTRGCVFIVFADETEKSIVYDCSESREALLNIACGETLTMQSAKLVDIDGEPYQLIGYTIPPMPDGTVLMDYQVCIEGFGFLYIDFFCKNKSRIRLYDLVECYEDDENLSWVIEQGVSLPDYDGSGKSCDIKEIHDIPSQQYANGKYYDLQGLYRVNHSIPNGNIYIIGGKKYAR